MAPEISIWAVGPLYTKLIMKDVFEQILIVRPHDLHRIINPSAPLPFRTTVYFIGVLMYKILDVKLQYNQCTDPCHFTLKVKNEYTRTLYIYLFLFQIIKQAKQANFNQIVNTVTHVCRKISIGPRLLVPI